jgi:hypothetical protein
MSRSPKIVSPPKHLVMHANSEFWQQEAAFAERHVFCFISRSFSSLAFEFTSLLLPNIPKFIYRFGVERSPQQLRYPTETPQHHLHWFYQDVTIKPTRTKALQRSIDPPFLLIPRQKYLHFVRASCSGGSCIFVRLSKFPPQRARSLARSDA